MHYWCMINISAVILTQLMHLHPLLNPGVSWYRRCFAKTKELYEYFTFFRLFPWRYFVHLFYGCSIIQAYTHAWNHIINRKQSGHDILASLPKVHINKTAAQQYQSVQGAGWSRQYIMGVSQMRVPLAVRCETVGNQNKAAIGTICFLT